MKGCKHTEDYIMSLDEDGETNICAMCLINDVRNETLDKAMKLKEIAIKLRDDPKMCGNKEEDKIKNINFWQGYIEACLNIIDENSTYIPELKSALIAMKKENEDLRMSKYWKINKKLVAEISKLKSQLADKDKLTQQRLKGRNENGQTN